MFHLLSDAARICTSYYTVKRMPVFAECNKNFFANIVKGEQRNRETRYRHEIEAVSRAAARALLLALVIV